MGGFLSHFLVPGTGWSPLQCQKPWCWARTELSWWMGGIPPWLLSRAGLLKLIVMLSSSGHWVSPLSCLCQALGLSPWKACAWFIFTIINQAPGQSHFISLGYQTIPHSFPPTIDMVTKIPILFTVRMLETEDDCDLCSVPEIICHSPCHIRSLIGPHSLSSLVTLSSYWLRTRWQQSWQIFSPLIGWLALNHGQFLKLLRVKMPASVDNIFWALLLTDVYFIFFMSYGWVVPWRGGWELRVSEYSHSREEEKQKGSPSIVLITKQVTRSIYEKCKQCQSQ